MFFEADHSAVRQLCIKNLQSLITTITCSERFNIIIVSNILLINVYLPCSGTVDRLSALSAILADIWQWRELYIDCVCIICGDFNCDLNVSSHASTVINDFLSSRNLYRCDLAMSHKVDYTFHNDSSNCYSYIDYFVTSDSQLITKFQVLDSGSFLSDHLPIAIILGYTLAPIVSKPSSSCHPSQDNYLRWDHTDIQSYYSVTGELFQQLMITLNETDTEHFFPTEIADFVNNVNNIVEILYSISIEYIPAGKKTFYKFWWDQELDTLKDNSIQSNKLWKATGMPHPGPVFNQRKSDKLTYKLCLKERQALELKEYSNDLHKALINKNGKDF